MRYLGNKAKLIPLIEDTIKKHEIKGSSFADLFSGTSNVGDHFKDKYEVTANDSLYYSYILTLAKLENGTIPDFKNFYKKNNVDDIFYWINNLEFKVDDSYFIYHNYSPVGERMFFTESNAIKIDGIRQKIESLYNDQVVTRREYTFLLASLLESVTRYSNTTGTYEAFLKKWDPRALKEFTIAPLTFRKTNNLKSSVVYQKDTNELVKEIEGDIAYIDPPYTVTQYISAYHMLETIAKYDMPVIKGVGGKRGRDDKNSLYAQRKNALVAFEDLLRQINYEHVLISYSTQGLIEIEELISLSKTFAVNSEVHINYFDHREYRNHRSKSVGKISKLKEVIIYFKKNKKIIKSPLNYSGSKDKLVPKIIAELPQKVDTFVDVMGGAFNVGINIQATNMVVYNEINEYIYGMISWLIQQDKEEIVKEVESVIKENDLDKSNKEAYLKFREKYNVEKYARDLFILHMYSFQNMIRFNSNHIFNTPVGVAGYSNDIKRRILQFRPKTKDIKLLNKDYIDIDWESYPKDTVFYFDPPYYITNAAYNDGKRGMKGWNENLEIELLEILKKLDIKGYKFMLSNVLVHKDKEHELLINWVKDNNYNTIEMGKTGWRYSKIEVLIKNF